MIYFFSALAMTEQLSLLYIMVLSLKNMIKEVLIPCELHDEELNQHKVVDNAKHVLKDHCYWPLVSDLNNVLSHPSIAFRFMGDNSLLTMWFDFLKVIITFWIETKKFSLFWGGFQVILWYLHQISQNMTIDCWINYDFRTRKLQVQ